ncbi:MAG: hypothetical protein GXP27_17295 [Planctomycetes bacterium]|nr:hypothetical protein [Planctomycetota bacterium]
MNRARGFRRIVGWPVLLVGLTALAGCQNLHLPQWPWPLPEWRSQSPEKNDSDEFETKVETPLIGDYISFAGLNLVTLEGVGLVTGLDGTGGDPPPSVYRTRMYKEMKRRGIAHPNEILSSPNTALVIVRAYLPPLVRKGEHFDVEVRVPEGSNATSLNGGWLLETFLAEQAVVPGQGVLEGHVLAKAKGPILISTGVNGDEETLAGVLRRGRILGGGISMTNRDLTIYLRSDFRSVRNSRRIANRIGQRFHAYNRHGIKEPLAEAKTDQTIRLKVPKRYKDNYPRYLQVIRNMAFRETPVARRLRMERLESELNVPETAERAALQLEAIGTEAVPILRRALDHPDLEVRFHSAMALAYLNQTDGLKVLAEAALKERAFRVYALAGLAAVDEAESIMILRDLLSAQQDETGHVYDSAELRYGAFRALWTLDKNDPFIRGESMNGQFSLHVLDPRGEPILHLTHRKRAEIVLFGADQKFLPPMAVRAGNHILVTAQPGSETVTLSRYEPGRPDRRRTVSTLIAEVIRAAVDLGASYPDVAQMLIQANRQHNLASRLEIDAMPRAGRRYERRRSGAEPVARRARRLMVEPNLFTGGPAPAARRDTSPRSPARASRAKPAQRKDQSKNRPVESAASEGLPRPSVGMGHAAAPDLGTASPPSDSSAEGTATLADARTATSGTSASDSPRQPSSWLSFLRNRRWLGGRKDANQH